jgi:hypothetical protein
MHPTLQSYYLRYLDAGYVLLMSQYRGGDGSEGADEYGGADIADVTTLVTGQRTIAYTPTTRSSCLRRSCATAGRSS